MLEPDTRELLLDVLRPPDGWSLGHAMGTTYTLDLQALLLAPLAFAMFDWAMDEGGSADPLALFESLQRCAGLTTVFHQAGMIKVPPVDQPLLVHLEDIVVPVTPPNVNAIFHPKVWLLQFVREGHDPIYRLVVLSRNLTFDTSWDTVVVLEGTRRSSGAPAASLGAFVRDLVASADGIDEGRRSVLTAIADDVVAIDFAPPDGMDAVALHPMGYGDSSWPFPTDASKVVVVSPFLGASTVGRLTASGHASLISRPEALDGIGGAALSHLDRVMVLGDAVSADDAVRASEPALDGAKAEMPGGSALRGLHAKVFAFESGDTTRLFVGSANATSAAMSSNIEFMVECTASSRELPVDGLLDGGPGITSFGDLCQDYTPSDEPIVDEAEAIASKLDGARRTVGRATYETQVEEAPGGHRVTVRAASAPQLPPEVTSVTCWPITLGRGHPTTPVSAGGGWIIPVGVLSEASLTAFYVFEIEVTIEGRSERDRFVVTAPLTGDVPEDRPAQVIARLLRDRSDVLRYLLFLLADNTRGLSSLLDQIGSVTNGSSQVVDPFGQSALLETLLRALVRDPGKLDHVGRLLRDLAKAGREDLTPDGLDALWAVIAEVRAEATA